jgi:hypothetical protein
VRQKYVQNFSGETSRNTVGEGDGIITIRRDIECNRERTGTELCPLADIILLLAVMNFGFCNQKVT